MDMPGNKDIFVFQQIERETQTYLKGEQLKVARMFLDYIKTSGRTWLLEEGGHPEFYYKGELTSLVAFAKTVMDEEETGRLRALVEGAGNRFVYEPGSSWNLCCWQHDDDIAVPPGFSVDEGLIAFAQSHVWKCIPCGGCDAPGGLRREVFGKTFDNACCNVYQFANPDEGMMKDIIRLMEWEKSIIDHAKGEPTGAL